MIYGANLETRLALLNQLFKKCGKNPVIEPPFYCDYGSNITIGCNFYSNHNLIILDGARVTIGNDVFIAPNVGIYTAGHPLDPERRNQGLEYAHPVTIGNNVWIGAGVSIVPGITIGNDTVIGAGSIVVKDIPSGVLAVGNPCRVVREITDKDRSRPSF
ncbi:sugar O-acetyltransferase [Erwinia amylovora]